MAEVRKQERAHRRAAARRGHGDQPALLEKEPGEYDLVFDVKSDGWFNVLHAVR